jgi:hypothetical protein
LLFGHMRTSGRGDKREQDKAARAVVDIDTNMQTQSKVVLLGIILGWVVRLGNCTWSAMGEALGLLL